MLVVIFICLLFGLIVGRYQGMLGVRPFVYGIPSLTVIRMLPVPIALAGSGLARSTVAFMGWFGPRGLASVVLGLVCLEQEKHVPGEEITRLAVMATVLPSIFAHGITAVPGNRLHAKLAGFHEHEADPESAVVT